ncbi:alanine acetyltransferase [Ktedonobacter sp. SOSP1-85]|uniref:GNAT family N-acetyltransferase n=1 Tax=Ktedonobacter sp. SOSP1-85 TaxID=2778367 RepID=UPI0019156274|nr:GNAT family protein [Ktedonobacter sp. SOSP1-85]GHO81821.1 alanine acetyltransferase [Ktedonobacter sp. SOSP1-85]
MLLHGKKCYLRTFTQEDLPIFKKMQADPEFLTEYNFFGLSGQTSRREQRFQENGLIGPKYGALVVMTHKEEIAGDISYRQVHGGPTTEGTYAFNIGIALLPEHRGKGYGSEAQRLLAEYLFAVFPVRRVDATTDITNIPEQRALVKAGFTREGVLRQVQWRMGDWHDMVVYSKLRGE